MSRHILTNSGRYFYFHSPETHNFSVPEIAHALSHICRFTGHVKEFYSVAQHSVYVSLLVPPELALSALMHDASEAYLGDVSSPLKAMLPDYREIEARVEEAIFSRFGLPFPLPAEVKLADLQMLMAEKRDVMVQDSGVATWPDAEPAAIIVQPVSPRAARDMFMARWDELVKEKQER